MKKLGFLFCLLPLLAFECSDSIEFADNQRLLFTGRVTDTEGNALADIPVKIYASRRDFSFIDVLFGSTFDEMDGELVVQAVTDENGVFERTTLGFSSIPSIAAFIDEDSHSPNRASLVINGIDALELVDQTYDIGTVSLDAILDFQFNVERQTNTTDTLQYSVQYGSLVKLVNLNSFIDPLVSARRTNISSGTVLLDSSGETTSFRVRNTDTLFFEYQLINEGVLETESLEIPVNTSNGSFTFRF